jgi:hypothetical protein
MIGKDEFVGNRAVVNNQPQIREVKNVVFARHETGLMTRIMIGAYRQKTDEDPKKVTTNYTIEQNGKRTLNYIEPNTEEVKQLILDYRKDPIEAAALARVNLIELARDKRIPEPERKQRLERYTQAYIDLVVKLDRLAFPPDGPGVVHEGVPEYIPDGLSDMGSQQETEPEKRSREKIRVDKADSYKKYIDDLVETYWALRNKNSDPSSSIIKDYLIKRTMKDVYREMPYDHKGNMNTGKSVRIGEYVNSYQPVAVCRHIAMETQLRFQLLGIDSRLLKCNQQTYLPHVANLVRNNGVWYLADSTQPEINLEGTLLQPYLKVIDTSRDEWTLKRNQLINGEITPVDIKYQSRFDMLYRVMDNQQS